jgi:F-type H+-transporting ATPase subunit b
VLIDWFTVGAQAFNFILLVWLMKRFLYKPILDAIEEREKRIAEELARADSKMAEAQKEQDEFKKKNEDLDGQRSALLVQATEEAKKEGKRLLDEARSTADAWAAKRGETMRNDALSLGRSISRRAGQEVFAVARKVLTDLSATSLEERIGEVFIQRLKGLEGKPKLVLAEALRKDTGPAVLRSAYVLSASRCAEIQKTVNETFSAEIPLRFETEPEQISGIELIANGQKVAWNIEDYLTTMEERVLELLDEREAPSFGTGAKVVAEGGLKTGVGPGTNPKVDVKPIPGPEEKIGPGSNPESKGP